MEQDVVWAMGGVTGFEPAIILGPKPSAIPD